MNGLDNGKKKIKETPYNVLSLIKHKEQKNGNC